MIDTCVDAARRVLSPILFRPSSAPKALVTSTRVAPAGGRKTIGATRSRLAGAVNASTRIRFISRRSTSPDRGRTAVGSPCAETIRRPAGRVRAPACHAEAQSAKAGQFRPAGRRIVSARRVPALCRPWRVLKYLKPTRCHDESLDGPRRCDSQRRAFPRSPRRETSRSGR